MSGQSSAQESAFSVAEQQPSPQLLGQSAAQEQ
jgi:hypothetical protein